jgi:ubiquinone/menaquinone biosynthesis C-methylase UbiE
MYENGSLSRVTGGVLHPGGQPLTERLLVLCELPANARILDIGCGSGSTVELLMQKGFQAVGVDHSELLLSTKKNQGLDLPLVCSWGKSLPVASGYWDAVLSECSLSAMSNLEVVLSECWRVLRPGGRLAVSDIYARNPEGIPALHTLPLQCGLRDAHTQCELLERFQAHGFKTHAWEDRSDALKYLAAQMILSHGSLSEFWSCTEPAADPAEIQMAIGRAKLGYYVCVLRRDT